MKRITDLCPQSSPTLRPSSRGKRGFTLIEMLMVLVIFGILMGLSVAFFQGISQGSKLEQATTELKNTFLLARQLAITKRQTVYVVFPATDTAVFGGSVSNAAYRSYVLCTTNEFIREWSFLPEGIYFDPDYPSQTSVNNLFRAQVSGTNLYAVTIPALWSGVQPALAFRPNGALTLNIRTPEIALGEGTKFPGVNLPSLNGETRNKIQIYGFTGMPQMMRLLDAQ